MPHYEYECAGCGAFSALRPIAEYDRPVPCPGCGDPAPRAVSVPSFAMADRGRFAAHAVNERSAHAPRSSAAHGAGCGCCRPRTKTDGAPKSAPSGRPWMIGH